MVKNKLYILDSCFSQHDICSIPGLIPDRFEWVKGSNKNLTIFTDNYLNISDSVESECKIAWIIESPAYHKFAYDYIKENSYKFNNVFTCSKDILNYIKNGIFLPIGGCWIKEKDRGISEKIKIVSIISSYKKLLEGHNLRHEIIKKFKNIYIYGNGYNPIKNKIEGLKDYCFSIVIENTKEDYYFTEKLIDCFVTGTIPIYWGCPSISDFFDINGMICFNSLEDLHNILDNLTVELYNSKIEHIKNNYLLSQKYLLTEDILYKELEKITVL